MEQVFAAVWFGFVAGIGGFCTLFGISHRSDGFWKVTFKFTAGVWLYLPMGLGVWTLSGELGFLAIFAVIPAWSVGFEALGTIFTGTSIATALGVVPGREMSGWAQIGFGVLGLAVVAPLVHFSKLDMREPAK